MSVGSAATNWKLTWSSSSVELVGSERSLTFDAEYLLDLVGREKDLVSGQFRKSILDLPTTASITSAELTDEDAASVCLTLQFEELPEQPFHIELDELLADVPLELPPVSRWKKRPEKSSFLSCCLGDLESTPADLHDWLTAFLSSGLAFLKNVPNNPSGLRRVVSLFGYIRETNYGPIFDVRTEATANNLAYTSDGLMLHTDNPYREPVPGLQLLHCIENSAEGGESILADGFAAALRLKEESIESFQLLTQHKVCFRFKDLANGTYLEAERPMIELDDEEQIKAVHFNHRSLQAIRFGKRDESVTLRDAYRRPVRRTPIVNDVDYHLTFKLEPGEAMLFDNHRLLHGRAGFDIRSGARHLQGCYCDKDSLWSKWRFLQMSGASDV